MSSKMYKVWNFDRSLKKAVFANNLEELKKKGHEKLKMCCDLKDVTAVLESDGTEVDDDEILEALKEEVIILLGLDNVWSAVSSGNLSTQYQTLTDIPVHHKSATPESALPQVSAHVHVDAANAACVSDAADVACVAGPSISHLENQNEWDDYQTKAMVCRSIRCDPLPKFSATVRSCLEKNCIEIAWDDFVNQTAAWVEEKFPSFKESAYYRLLGERMYQTWPAIRTESKGHPWSFFTKCLSQKLRHIRHNAKRKSQLIGSVQRQGQPAKSIRVVTDLHVDTSRELSEEEIESHITELKKEWNKPTSTRNVAHIKVLLKETTLHRKDLLKKSKTLLKDLFELFPCFTDGSYVLYDFAAQFGADRIKEVSGNLKKVVAACHTLMGRSDTTITETADTMLAVVDFIEKETKFDRLGKSSKLHFKSLIDIYDDIPDCDVSGKLLTKENASPHIKVFRKERSEITGLFIVGDTVTVRCEGTSVCSCILELLGIYYLFDIDYPKCFAMALGLFQMFVMGEPLTYETSKKFKMFLKRFRPAFQDL